MFPTRALALVLITLLVAACGSGSPDPDRGQDPGGACARTLAGEVTMPTRLAPTGGECDYLLSGTLYVTSELRIDPGTTIVAAPASRIYVQDGGRIVASGTPTQRIEFVGSVATLGSWYGVCFSGDHLESRLDNVDIYWAGAVFSAGSHVCRAALGSVSEGGEPVHVTDSLIVGAYTSGIDATRFTLGEFRGNVLAGHREYGMRVSANNMGRLDATTNFGGTGVTYPDGSSAANGKPYVALAPSTLDIVDAEGEYQQWVPVDVPYHLTSDDLPYSGDALSLDEGSRTVIAPGTRFVMAPGTLVIVEWGAALGLDGTAEAPVRFDSEAPGPGRWEGFWMYGGGLLADHAVFTGAGNSEGLITRGAITFDRVYGPSHCSHIKNLTVSGSLAHGVVITEDHEGLVRVDGATFEDVAGNGIVGANSGPAVLDGAPCV